MKRFLKENLNQILVVLLVGLILIFLGKNFGGRIYENHCYNRAIYPKRPFALRRVLRMAGGPHQRNRRNGLYSAGVRCGVCAVQQAAKNERI